MKSCYPKYLVLGAARSGLSALRLLRSFNRDAFLCDDKDLKIVQQNIPELSNFDVPCFCGKDVSKAPLDDTDILVVSPGIPPDHPLLKKAAAKGIDVIGELELGFAHTKANIASVTGTNGKTTTACIASHILQYAGLASKPVGNVGFPLSSAVLDPRINHESAVLVVEVSSFQLETIQNYHSRVAVLLNITPDHLDRHGSMANYTRLKYRITENQNEEDILIINADDKACLELREISKAKSWLFSLKQKVSPGAYLEGRELKINITGGNFFLPINEIPIPGLHNVQNVLAAALVATAIGVPTKIIREAICHFKGVEHRIELFARLQHVSFYNDSKATNLDSMEKAILSFLKPVILIAGGRDKGNDYEKIAPLIKDNVKLLLVMGEAADLMISAWAPLTPTQKVSSLPEAVNTAFNAAVPGDIVLFSPGCSSFDAFENFEHRGNAFKKSVQDFIQKKELGS